MKRRLESALGRLGIAALVFGAACSESSFDAARALREQGRQREAALAFSRALAGQPGAPGDRQEAQLVASQWLDGLGSTDRQPPPTAEDLEVGMEVARNLERKSEFQVVVMRLAETHEAAGETDKALATLSERLAPLNAQRAAELQARLMQRHPKHPKAAEISESLYRAWPKSATVCIASASFLSDQRRFAEATGRYDACTEIEGQSIEQALYIGTQKAAIAAVQEAEGAPGAKRKAPKSKGRR